METNAVVTAITAQATSLTGDAATVIAAGLGIGALFFGARLLWRKFKGMAS